MHTVQPLLQGARGIGGWGTLMRRRPEADWTSAAERSVLMIVAAKGPACRSSAVGQNLSSDAHCDRPCCGRPAPAPRLPAEGSLPKAGRGPARQSGDATPVSPKLTVTMAEALDRSPGGQISTGGVLLVHRWRHDREQTMGMLTQ